MEKVYDSIEQYLANQFGKKALIMLDNKITEDDGELYGMHSIKIIVREEGNKIYYKPFFKN